MAKYLKIVLTVAVVGLAIGLVAFKYEDYLRNPWTRDGQVRADVVAVAPRVTGPIVELPIVDNQRVKTGDLLFRIDPRTFKAQFDQAKANYDNVVDQLESLDEQVRAGRASVAQAEAQVSQAQAQIVQALANVKQAESEYRRLESLVKDGFTSRSNFDMQLRNFQVAEASRDQAQASLTQATSALSGAKAQLAAAIAKRGATGDDNAQLRAAQAALEVARLNLEFTEQRASVDGYVTNLNLQLGSLATANQPAMALVDEKSFWIAAYFRETMIEGMKKDNRAYVTLMSYPDIAIPGRVDSLGWGIARQDGSVGAYLLPVVQPSFEWIRLAQRIPVKIVIDKLPPGVALRVGATASVLVRRGAGGEPPPPAPSLLQ